MVIMTKKTNWLERVVMLFKMTIEKSLTAIAMLSRLFLSELSRNSRIESVRGSPIIISSVILLISLS